MIGIHKEGVRGGTRSTKECRSFLIQLDKRYPLVVNRFTRLCVFGLLAFCGHSFVLEAMLRPILTRIVVFGTSGISLFDVVPWVARGVYDSKTVTIPRSYS